MAIKNKDRSVKFSSVYDRLNKYSLIIELVIAIITVLLSFACSYYITNKQIDVANREANEHLKYELCRDFIEKSNSFKTLRLQYYEESFSIEFWYLSEETLNEGENDTHSILKENFITSSEAERTLDETYIELASELKVLLLLVDKYYDDIEQDLINNCMQGINQPINLNQDLIEVKYYKLLNSEKDAESFTKKLREYMKSIYYDLFEEPSNELSNSLLNSL